VTKAIAQRAWLLPGTLASPCWLNNSTALGPLATVQTAWQLVAATNGNILRSVCAMVLNLCRVCIGSVHTGVHVDVGRAVHTSRSCCCYRVAGKKLPLQ
jgi:hypothetical protein